MTRIETLVTLYTSIFGKDPDSSQLDEYTSLNENIPLETIAATMLQQPFALALPSSSEAFVKASFQTLFNYTSLEMEAIIQEQEAIAAEGGIDGFEYWVNELDNNPMITKETLYVALINGSNTEYENILISKAEDIVSQYEILDDVEGAIQGTQEADILNGTEEDDTMLALGGNDTIRTFDGINTVYAGFGDDIIYGGKDTDTIYADQGADTVYASDGADIVNGGEGNDYIYGEAGDDTIDGGVGDDYIYGGDGDDTIDAGDGNDTIHGDAGDNSLYGGAGNDTIFLGEGENFVDGGEDDDQIYGNSSSDTIYGGFGNDTIYGYGESDTLFGMSGNDIIYAGDGDDILSGGDGDDILYGSSGDDTLYAESGNDKIVGGEGKDTLSGGAGQDTFAFASLESISTSMDTIVDFNTFEDIIELVNQGDEQKNIKLDTSGLQTITEALTLASSGDGSTNSIINWFEFEESTYLVQDLSANTTFDETKDIVVQIQGILDLESLNILYS